MLGLSIHLNESGIDTNRYPFEMNTYFIKDLETDIHLTGTYIRGYAPNDFKRSYIALAKSGILFSYAQLDPKTKSQITGVVGFPQWRVCVCTSVFAEGVNCKDVRSNYVVDIKRRDMRYDPYHPYVDNIVLEQMCGRVDREVKGGICFRLHQDAMRVVEATEKDNFIAYTVPSSVSK
jgi:hypothetical protein